MVVQSSLWTQDASTLRQWLDDVEFCGGGNQPVALAEALLEAAALLELPTALEPPAQGPGAGVPAQQQLKSRCLVCMVSEPSTNAVAWPYPSAYGQVRAGRGLEKGGRLQAVGCCDGQLSLHMTVS